MKTLILICICLSLNIFAHDEGHGPKLKDAPRRGGRVTSVILEKEINQGEKAKLIYKAELIRKKSENKVLVYFYDKDMLPIKSASFGPVAKATMISGKAGKEINQQFELKFVKDHFEGIAPKPANKRYNIDIRVGEPGRELFAAFDNLD